MILTSNSRIIFLVSIIVLAAVLRLANLSANPPAAYGDEISFAWNAWSILKTGADEYGNRFPLQFRAFDDYKAPLPVYLLVPAIGILGLNTGAVRLPVALFGVATVYLTYVLGKKLWGGKIGLLSSLLLTISSWHLHLSRGYFEATMALFFFVASLNTFILAKEKIHYLYLSAVFFGFTLYTYFTPRISLLFFIPFLLVWGKGWLSRSKKSVLLFLVLLMVILIPLIKLTLFDKGTARIDKLVSSRNELIQKAVIETRNSVGSPEIIKKLLHNRPVYWVREVVNDYAEHFSLDFWYLYGDSSLRYFLGNMGMFYLIELPFLLIGLPLLWRRRDHFWLLTGWLLIAPIPAAIAGRPFAVRSLAMLPAPFFIVSLGITRTWRNLTDNGQNALRVWLVIGFGVSIGYYLIRYHLEYPTYAATWWGWENKAAIDLALKDEKKYEQIFISNFYTGAELALAYYIGYDPQDFRQAKANPVFLADGREFIKLGKFYVGSLDLNKQRLVMGLIPAKSLYIGRPEEADSPELITAPNDGRILFKIYRTD